MVSPGRGAEVVGDALGIGPAGAVIPGAAVSAGLPAGC